jgi:hypothetical protein
MPHPADALIFIPIGAHVDSPAIAIASVLTPPPDGASKIMMQTMSQSVRYTLDGTTPTALVGFRLPAGNDPIILYISNQTTLTVIQEAATADFQYQWGS